MMVGYSSVRASTQKCSLLIAMHFRVEVARGLGGYKIGFISGTFCVLIVLMLW